MTTTAVAVEPFLVAAGPKQRRKSTPKRTCAFSQPEAEGARSERVEPFSFEAWERIAPPASPEELAEMEELLAEREAERQAYQKFVTEWEQRDRGA